MMELKYQKKVLVLPSDTPAYEAARAMNEKSVGCVLVSDGSGHISGIVTDRDIACGIVGERMSPDSPIIEVMATKPVYVDVDAKLTKVLQLMQRHGIRRIPVFSSGRGGTQKCVGICTLDDLILSGRFTPEMLKPVIKKQIRSPQQRNFGNLRRTSRKEHTLNHFFKVMAETMELDPDMSERVTTYLLKSLVQRVTPQLASNLIAEIPSLLQEDLLNTKAGPTRRNNLSFLLEGMKKRFGISENEAMRLLPRFWSGLGKNLKSGAPAHLMSSLPQDLKAAFTAPVKPFKPIPIRRKARGAELGRVS